MYRISVNVRARGAGGGEKFQAYYMYGTLIGPVVLSTAVGKKGFTTETKETVRLGEQRPTLKICRTLSSLFEIM